MMEFNYTILPAERLVRLQCWGDVTAEHLIGLMKRIGTELDYHPKLPVLADFREAQGEWDYSEIQRFRDYLVDIGRHRDGVRWAALVGSGSLTGVGHVVILITEAIATGINMRLFEDPTAALQWLRGE
jgi:hypothetical protein